MSLVEVVLATGPTSTRSSPLGPRTPRSGPDPPPASCDGGPGTGSRLFGWDARRGRRALELAELLTGARPSNDRWPGRELFDGTTGESMLQPGAPCHARVDMRKAVSATGLDQAGSAQPAGSRRRERSRLPEPRFTHCAPVTLYGVRGSSRGGSIGRLSFSVRLPLVSLPKKVIFPGRD